jgi:hypothetical protein
LSGGLQCQLTHNNSIIQENLWVNDEQTQRLCRHRPKIQEMGWIRFGWNFRNKEFLMATDQVFVRISQIETGRKVYLRKAVDRCFASAVEQADKRSVCEEMSWRKVFPGNFAQPPVNTQYTSDMRLLLEAMISPSLMSHLSDRTTRWIWIGAVYLAELVELCLFVQPKAHLYRAFWMGQSRNQDTER